MSAVGSLVALTAVAVIGVLLIASAWLQPAPRLDRVIAHLRRGGDEAGYQPTRHSTAPRRLVAPALSLAERYPALVPTRAQLVLVDRTVDQHVALLVVASLLGLVVPAAAIGALQAAGILGLWWFAPAVVALAGAVLAPMLVHSSTVERANAIRSDLRYQVSAFLDVVTMLLAGNTGYEGALEQAALAGDGRLFAELRRRMREAGARGTSLTAALESAGADLGLEELERIAAAAALSAAEGAPVARTLAAKCATLRASLATEQETEARLRTSRLTTPIVGMALIFMAMVIYPALNFAT
ncbi:MAG TPA: type II secretion system F family protein [Ilumatobacter sp.]|nr:type II secretion system F family protein [Ilumatobacter sp.]